MEESSFRYRAFISYSHEDLQWVKWLHGRIERYRVPVQVVESRALRFDRLTPVFRDRDELPTSADLGSEIHKALDASESMIVVCSQAAAASLWVNEEIRYFRSLGRANRVFSVIAPDVARGVSIPANCFPQALFEDAGEEPLFADARPDADGRKNASLKLIAGLLDVGFGELQRREDQRRHTRLAVIAVASIAGMLITGGLAISLAIARNEADTQRIEAEREAESSSRVTEFLVELFEFSDPSTARGRDVTAREVLERGKQRIATELKTQPEIQQRLMRTMGRVYVALGLYQDGGELLEQAHDLGLVTFAADHPETAANLARLAEFRGLQSKHEDSMALWLQSLEMRERLYGPNHVIVTDSLQGAGFAAYFLNDGTRGVEYMNRALEIRRGSPDGTAFQIAESLYGLGLIYDAIGRPKDAEAYLRESLATYESADLTRTREFLQASKDLGQILSKAGRYHEAEQLQRATFEAANEFFPSGHRLLGEFLRDMADALDALGKSDEAEASLREAIATFRNNIWAEGQLARSLDSLVVTLIRQGRYQEALAPAAEAITLTEKLYGPDNWETGRVTNNLAAVYLLSGDSHRAESLFRNSLRIRLATRGEEHPSVANARSNLADTLNRLGHFTEAEDLARAAAERYESIYTREHWRAAVARSILAASLAGQRQLDAASKLIEGTCDLIREARGSQSYTIDCLQRQANLHRLSGQQSFAKDVENLIESMTLPGQADPK